MRPLEDLKRKKDNLLKKHPGLTDVRVLPLRETDWTYQKLSAFVERCFSHGYGNEPRIRFTPEFLEWNMPIPLGVLILDDRDRWLGCALSFSRTYNRDGEAREYVISTAASIIPEMRGRGLVQLLNLSLNESELLSGSEFSIFWLDNRHRGRDDAKLALLKRMEKSLEFQTVNLFGKSIDCRKARIHGGFNTATYAAVWTAHQVFPSRRGNRFPDGFRLEPFCTDCIDGYLALIEAVDRCKRFRRIYEREGLARLLSFHKNAFHTLCYSLNDRGGMPWALLYGYKLLLRDNDWAFFADGMVFHPDLTWQMKRLFLSECEGTLREEEGCIGTTLVGTTTEEPLWKYGYVSFGSQVLGFKAYADLKPSPQDLRELRIELR
jgi:hypothetical protein